MPGEHWIAIYVDDDGRYGEYFDSFGRAPTEVFERYMNEHCSEWTFNRKQLQSAIVPVAFVVIIALVFVDVWIFCVILPMILD